MQICKSQDIWLIYTLTVFSLTETLDNEQQRRNQAAQICIKVDFFRDEVPNDVKGCIFKLV